MAFFNAPGGPAALLNQLAGGFGPGMQPHGRPSDPRSYDDYLKAYSMAMMTTRERENVSYGGKIIMPPSALANLTRLDLESPWMFQLRNPSNSAAVTHAGVLEFIADEGVVHLPFWMMKSLRLNEGDPIRITGTTLQKGKFVKLQPQNTLFLEVSDPKAVLEQALRNFTALTQGDIIEISYNSIVFPLLVMETDPGGGGISVLDTDLEVDFATPVGYKEPERPKAPAPSTMASKLKLDLDKSHSPGSSRPGSSLSGGFMNSGSAANNAVSKDGGDWESFKGKGETLAGRRTKGKGITQRKAEEVSANSKIIRTDKHRIVSNATLDSNEKVPAALNLPFGQLFFGFNVQKFEPPAAPQPPGSPGLTRATPAFSGTGATLTGRSLPSNAISSDSTSKGKEKEKETKEDTWGALGSGNTLGKSVPRELGPVGAGGARIPKLINRGSSAKKQPVARERSPTPDWGVDDDDDDVVMLSD